MNHRGGGAATGIYAFGGVIGDSPAETLRCGMGSLPMNHGRDARATLQTTAETAEKKGIGRASLTTLALAV